MSRRLTAFLILLSAASLAPAADIKTTPLYSRIKAGLDATPAIDTHDHLRPFGEIAEPGRHGPRPGDDAAQHLRRQLLDGHQPPVALAARANRSTTGGPAAEHDFDNARATSSYRYLLPAFRDLYGVDFDTITDDAGPQVERTHLCQLPGRQVAGRRDHAAGQYRADADRSLLGPAAIRPGVQVLGAAVECDRDHQRLAPRAAWATPTALTCGPSGRERRSSRSTTTWQSVDKIFAEAVAADAVCLKSTQAYQRTLRYEDVPKERAAAGLWQAAPTNHAARSRRISRTSCSGRSSSSARSTSCRFRFTPATAACKVRARCCCWT